MTEQVMPLTGVKTSPPTAGETSGPQDLSPTTFYGGQDRKIKVSLCVAERVNHLDTLIANPWKVSGRKMVISHWLLTGVIALTILRPI